MTATIIPPVTVTIILLRVDSIFYNTLIYFIHIQHVMIGLKDFFSFQKNKFFWINIIGMVVVVIAASWGTLAWLDSYTRHGEAHIVPDVKNKSIEEAAKIISQGTMKYAVIDSNYVKGVPAGMVLEQAPAAGSRVKEGRAVYLTITTTSVPLVQLPDIIDNSSIRQRNKIPWSGT